MSGDKENSKFYRGLIDRYTKYIPDLEQHLEEYKNRYQTKIDILKKNHDEYKNMVSSIIEYLETVRYSKYKNEHITQVAIFNFKRNKLDMFVDSNFKKLFDDDDMILSGIKYNIGYMFTSFCYNLMKVDRIPYYIRFPSTSDIEQHSSFLNIGSMVKLKCCNKICIITRMSFQENAFNHTVTSIKVKQLDKGHIECSDCLYYKNHQKNNLTELSFQEKLDKLKYKFYPLIRACREHLKWKPDSKFLQETGFFEEKQNQLNKIINC